MSDLGVGLVVGDHGCVRYVNEAFGLLTGYSAEELLATGTLAELVAPDARDSFLALARRPVGDDTELGRYETERVHRDGLRVAVEVGAATVAIEGRCLPPSRLFEVNVSVIG
ncbi:MAG: PAS domain S-box protein [Actinomycetota bacterium]|nr:PAS domain S-box protein [Actinomycetota bacterium]